LLGAGFSPLPLNGKAPAIEAYGAEGVARIGLSLERLLAGLDVIGVDREEALRVIERVAEDSVPPQRRAAYQCVAGGERWKPVMSLTCSASPR
jgi:hypothetical protein